MKKRNENTKEVQSSTAGQIQQVGTEQSKGDIQKYNETVPAQAGTEQTQGDK